MATFSNDPYAPPVADPRTKREISAPQRQGDALVVDREAELPDLCLKCGTRSEVTKRRQSMIWYPPWSWLVFLGCLAGPALLVGLLVLVAVRRRAVVRVPLCRRCNTRRRWVVAAEAACVVWALGGMVLGWSVLASGRGYAGLAIILLAVAVPVAERLLLARRHLIWPRRIDRETVTLGGAGPAALEALETAGRSLAP